jgi:hypothetical protein
MSLPIDPISDHQARALATLLSQWGGAVKLKGLLAALIERVQEADDDAWALIGGRMLATAEGAQLDILGSIVGQLRGGISDDDYRRLIEVRIQANLARGRVTALLQIAATLVGAPVTYTPAGLGYVPFGVPDSEHQGAAFRLDWEVDAISDDMVRLLRRVISDIVPVGVAWEAVDARPGAFRFDTGDGFGTGILARKITP